MSQNKLKTISLGHGSGGRLSHDLIKNLFVKHFSNPLLSAQGDSAIITSAPTQLAFTTDSYVVDPLFFPGADIGKLAVAGTVNDLAVSGAVPKYLSAGFIIEEGLDYDVLESVVISMALEAKKAGVQIVTGDTKVVDKGKCDKLFINTAGIGFLQPDSVDYASARRIKVGDKIIINGYIGDHGMAVMAARNQLHIQADLVSDCACLHGLIAQLDKHKNHIRFMRDVTRGGLATVATEISHDTQLGIELYEAHIPVRENVRGICELLGFDPLYVANEGKVLLVVAPEKADAVLQDLHTHDLGKNAAIVGQITQDHPQRVWLHTSIGGTRLVDMLAGEQLPRIC